MKTGIIAQVLGKTPASVGYDLVPKRPNQKFCKGPQDYELLFRGFTSTNPADVSKVLGNFDQSLDRIYKDEVKTQAVIKEELNEDKVLANLNGEVIKQIVIKNNQEGIVTDNDISEEQIAIVNTLMRGWEQVRLKRIDTEREIAAKIRKGTLDIWVENGTETLKVYDGITDSGDELWRDAPQKVPADQIKASLFFLLELHYKMDRFQEAINCEVQEGNYILAYEKGVLEFYMADGSDPTEFELKVMQDIKKIKM